SKLMAGPIVEPKGALLGEDLAGCGGLRAVRHLSRRDDRLAEFLDEARPLGFERGAGAVEVGSIHCWMVRASARPEGPPYPRKNTHNEERRAMAIEIDPVCGME